MKTQRPRNLIASTLTALTMAIPCTALAAPVRGKAFVVDPLTDATVRVTDSSGRVLQESPHATDETGRYRLDIADGITDFRVEVIDGLHQGKPFEGTLRADVHQFKPQLDLVYVNAATTLEASALDRRLGTDVKAALGVPSGMGLGFDLDSNRQPYFSTSAFLKEANRSGGFDAYVASWKPGLTFAQPAVVGGVGSSILDSAFESLVKGAAEKVGGEGAGWVMGLLLGETGESHDMAEIKNELAAQKEMLKNISAQITQLGLALDQAKDQIIASTDKASYDTSSHVLAAPISDIKALYQRLAWLAEAKPEEDNRKEVEDLRAAIKSTILSKETQIHDSLVTTAGAEGLLPLWNRIASRGTGYPRFVHNGYLNAAYSQFGYYYGAQLTALNLIVEVYHSDKPSNPRLAKANADLFAANLVKQKAYLPRQPWADDRVIADMKTGLMWQRDLARWDTTKEYYSSLYRGPAAGLQQTAMAMNLNGFKGWDLPTEYQSKTLVEGSSGDALGFLKTNGFVMQSLGFTTLSSTIMGNDGKLYYPYAPLGYLLPVRVMTAEELK